MDKFLQEINPNLRFKHEYHSLRVADRLSKRISQEKIEGKCGLNLTYEVRDGIVSHCGENYREYVLHADKTKTPDKINVVDHRSCMPFTLEACLVRLVDKIAYVGRDIEDAIRAKMIAYTDISREIREVLGSTNGAMINTLVIDLIENSYGKPCIQLSQECGEALRAMIEENNAFIYQSEMIKQYEKNATNTIEGLFKILYQYTASIWEELSSAGPADQEEISEVALRKMSDSSENTVVRRLLRFIAEKGYGKHEVPPEQIVVDYIAGMTDGYALKTYEELYWI